MPALLAYFSDKLITKKVYYFFRLTTFVIFVLSLIFLGAVKFRNPKATLVHKIMQKIYQKHQGMGILFLLVCSVVLCLDGIICYVLGLCVHKALVKDKKELKKQKNRAMMKKDHKGSIRIDTPPPNMSVE